MCVVGMVGFWAGSSCSVCCSTLVHTVQFVSYLTFVQCAMEGHTHTHTKSASRSAPRPLRNSRDSSPHSRQDLVYGGGEAPQIGSPHAQRRRCARVCVCAMER